MKRIAIAVGRFRNRWVKKNELSVGGFRNCSAVPFARTILQRPACPTAPDKKQETNATLPHSPIRPHGAGDPARLCARVFGWRQQG
jgi:hypothetical protein